MPAALYSVFANKEMLELAFDVIYLTEFVDVVIDVLVFIVLIDRESIRK